MMIVICFGAEYAVFGEGKLPLLDLGRLSLFGELFQKGKVTFLILDLFRHDLCMILVQE